MSARCASSSRALSLESLPHLGQKVGSGTQAEVAPRRAAGRTAQGRTTIADSGASGCERAARQSPERAGSLQRPRSGTPMCAAGRRIQRGSPPLGGHSRSRTAAPSQSRTALVDPPPRARGVATHRLRKTSNAGRSMRRDIGREFERREVPNHERDDREDRFAGPQRRIPPGPMQPRVLRTLNLEKAARELGVEQIGTVPERRGRFAAPDTPRASPCA